MRFPQRERQPDPALDLLAGLAENPRPGADSRPARHPADAPALRPAPSGVNWRLNSGVPATEVAAWAGHSVEVLMRVYARCVVGLEDVWTARMDASLRPPGEPGDRHNKDGNQKGEGPR